MTNILMKHMFSRDLDSNKSVARFPNVIILLFKFSSIIVVGIFTIVFFAGGYFRTSSGFLQAILGILIFLVHLLLSYMIKR